MSAFLSDGVVNLRPVTRADLPQLAAWRNDPELRSRTREFRPLTDVDQERWLERISGSDRRDFMFVVDVDGRAIGVVGLCHWEAVSRSAEISFYIGDESSRGLGFAKRGLELLQLWGFEYLGLHRLWAESYELFHDGHKMLLTLGFVERGTMRDVVLRDGKWVGSRFYDLLENEWRGHS